MEKLGKLLYMASNPPLIASVIVITALAMAISAWLKASYGGYGLLERTNKADKKFFRAMLALSLAYFLIYSFVSIHRYHKLLLWSWDLGIFESLVANALEGRFFVDFRGPFDHFSPAVVIYAPFYALWRDARVFLVMQTLVMALAVWPLYLLAKEASGRVLWGAIAGMLYLLHPLVGAGNLHDFHAVALTPLCFFSMMLFAVRERWGWYWFFAAALLLVKETEAILLLAAGLYLLSRKRWLVGALSVVASVGWVVLTTKVLIPWVTGAEFRHMGRYNLGTVATTLGWMLTTTSGASRLAVLTTRAAAVGLFALAGAAFLPARRWREFLFLCVPPIAVHVVATSNYQKYLFGHYGLTPAAGICVAAALALAPSKRAREAKDPSTLPVFVLTVAVLFHVVASFPAHKRWTYPAGYLSMEKAWNVLSLPVPLTQQRRSFYTLTNEERMFSILRDYIPKGSRVTAAKNLATFFAVDYELVDLSGGVEADYYLFDLSPERAGDRGVDPETFHPIMRRLEEDPSTLRFLDLSHPKRGGFVFFATEDKWAPVYERARRGLAANQDSFLHKYAVYGIERTLNLPPTVNPRLFAAPGQQGPPQ